MKYEFSPLRHNGISEPPPPFSYPRLSILSFLHLVSMYSIQIILYLKPLKLWISQHKIVFRTKGTNLPKIHIFMVKRENNAVPEFFKMFSIVQMMFIEEVILIQ